jgi:hypothetical protein
VTARRPKNLPRALCLTAFVSLTACLISCVSADVVAKFASNASKSLSQGTAIFADFPASVVRRDCFSHVLNLDFDFKPADEACVIGSLEQDNLSSAKKDRDDVLAVQKVLIDYFDAIQQLAAFGKTKDSSGKSKDDASSGSTSANNLKSKGKLTPNDVKAVTGLAQIVVKAFSAGYKNRELSRDLTDADDAVATITAALTHIVKDDYMYDSKDPDAGSLLNLEAGAMHRQYKDADGSPMLLRVSWTALSGKLLARNSSANSYLEALDEIKSGHHRLAKQPIQLNGQSLAADLEPYISSLESLIPQIQKVF